MMVKNIIKFLKIMKNVFVVYEEDELMFFKPYISTNKLIDSSAWP
jgi:hypothetical protein